MKIRPVDLNFPVIGLARVAYVIMIYIPGYSDGSYPKNEKHLVLVNLYFLLNAGNIYVLINSSEGDWVL
jgi:hypothetical protein